MIIELEKDNIFSYSCFFISQEDLLKEMVNNPFGKCLFYIEKGVILGYLYYSDIYERCEINQIEVDKNHRNCRIGTKLLGKLILTMKKNITLEVKKDNFVAIKLYKKFNFEEKAIRKRYYQGVDGILMERSV